MVYEPLAVQIIKIAMTMTVTNDKDAAKSTDATSRAGT